MTHSQSAFRNAILDASLPTPDGLIDGKGRPAGSRFSVYRNNVAVGLTDALAANFPVIEKLLGENNFKGVIGIFLRQNLPPTPLIIDYGLELPDFLADFEPVTHIGYLADVARLELALRQSFNAADSTAIDPAQLQSIAPDDLMNTRMTLAPSLRLMRSPWPVHAIWLMNTQDGAPPPTATPQDVLVTRPDYDPRPHLLVGGAAAFITALAQGQTLGDAHATATQEAAGFDLAITLGLLLDGQAITELKLNGTAK